MKVSHVENMDTHAVIGGQDVQAFGMSDSAEFFTILSDTLYSDKILAVAREIICNGWDSHIVAGCEDKPLDIKLTDNKLTIRDYGTGIPHDKIRPVYCVYGDSTKAKSDKETGGFGLGSKAPFAYTDHFTVTNWHDGVKTVYAISRGSVETGGKPDIRTIVSIPDGVGKGIEVSMPIKNTDDQRRFASVIKNVVYFGGINAMLNKVAIERLDYSLYQDDFVLVNKPSSISVEGNIFIKYGSVVYPIQRADEYADSYDEIQNIFRPNGYFRDDTNRMIIFEAPANSIAVTPSREGLSQTEKTRDTISVILSTFTKKKSDNTTKALKALVKLGCDHALKENSYTYMLACLASNDPMKNVPTIKVLSEEAVFTYYGLSMYCILTHGTSSNKYHNVDVSFTLEYIKYLSKHDHKNIELYRWLSKYLSKNIKNFHNSDMLNNIITRYRIMQIRKVLGSDSDLIRITARLGYGKHKMRTLKSYYDLPTLKSYYELPAVNFDKVLLASSDYAVSDFVGYSHTHYIAIRPGATKVVRERVINTLDNSNLKVENLLDIIEVRSDYPSTTDDKVAPRPKGFMKLSNCVNPTNHSYNSNMLDDVELDRIEKPKYAVYNRSDKGHHIIEGWGSNDFGVFLDLYPETAVMRNETSYRKQIEQGAKNPIDELFAMVDKYIKDNPDFLKKLDLTYFSQAYYTKDLSTYRKLFKYCPALRKKMGIMLLKSKKDKQIAELFYSMYGNQNNRSLSYENTQLMKDHFNAVEKLRKDSKQLEKVLKNRVLSSLNLNELLYILQDGSDPQKELILKLLNTALKGV